jgi:hypothetical protein
MHLPLIYKFIDFSNGKKYLTRANVTINLKASIVVSIVELKLKNLFITNGQAFVHKKELHF